MANLPGSALMLKIDNVRPTVGGERIVVNIDGGLATVPNTDDDGTPTGETVPTLIVQTPPAALDDTPITVNLSSYGRGSIALLWFTARNITAENNNYDFYTGSNAAGNRVRVITPADSDYYTGLVAVQLSNNSFTFRPTASALAEAVYTVELIAML